jgi:hypothetical protein
MQCLAVAKLPDGPEWEYEIRFDGYRALGIKSARRVGSMSRIHTMVNHSRRKVCAISVTRSPVDGRAVAIVSAPLSDIRRRKHGEAVRGRGFCQVARTTLPDVDVIRPLLALRNGVSLYAVRLIGLILLALLLPFGLNAPSIACAATACCGPNCSSNGQVNQLGCCKAPVAPDRATSQARDTQHLDSIATIPIAAAIVAISHLRNIVLAHGYSPPDRLASLALLCSRQI